MIQCQSPSWAACRVYRWLLVFYPRELRERYGAEMMLAFNLQMRDAWKRRGTLGATRVGLSAAWEIVSVAAPLQLRNPAVIAAALSFVCSSILMLAFFRAVSP